MKLTTENIDILFNEINSKLVEMHKKTAIYIYGGANLVYRFGLRPSSRDIDAVFDEKLMESIIAELAKKYKLPSDWMNSGVKCAISKKNDVQCIKKLSNLEIWSASLPYMLALKCQACRTEKGGHDIADIKKLIGEMRLKSSCEVYSVIYKYYHKGMFPVVLNKELGRIFNE